MSKFQVIVTGIFAIFIIVGVIVFATFKSKTETLPEVVIWGTLPAETFNHFVNEYSNTLPTPLHVTYVEKKEATFDDEYVRALARGEGPDALLIPQNLILQESDKIIPISFDTLPERTFKDTFVQEGEMFLTSQGTLALPFSVDPLIMYWNRDLFANQGISTYPRTWSDFSYLVSKITLKNTSADITRSAVAFGEYQNISHAKELLTTLFLQAGEPIISIVNGNTSVTLGVTNGNLVSPAASALSYYTHFADPSQADYSWNRSLPVSKNAFISGDLATYFGFLSEALDIRAKNPNLNFDVALFPQLESSVNRITYGKMHAFALSKSTKDVAATYNVISSLVGAPALGLWTQTSSLPPVRRDLLLEQPSDSLQSIGYNSALISRAWPDVHAEMTDKIFQSLVEDVTSGRSLPTQALTTARNQLQTLFPH